jgi:hypothetical protein
MRRTLRGIGVYIRVVAGATAITMQAVAADAMTREEIIIAAEKRDYPKLVSGLIEHAGHGNICSAFLLAMHQFIGIGVAGQPLMPVLPNPKSAAY